MNKKWLFALACVVLVIISMLPAYTEVPYDPRNTQDVINSIMQVSIQPYQAWGWVFHVSTLLLILYILWRPDKAGRVLAGYMGVNYLVIAAVQPHAVTGKYGFAIQTGAMVATVVIGIIFLVAAVRNSLNISIKNIPWRRYLLAPLAILVFWSPLRVAGAVVSANFDPRLLLTSADYGLTYCFVTPVFLYLLILFSTDHTSFIFRIAAINALLYALFNLTHWFNPNTIWLGVMHLPLLILSLVALFLPYLERIKQKTRAINLAYK